MPYADSSGVRLWYEEAGSGPPVLFLHELGSDARWWAGQFGRLAPGFRCIAPNARGYPPSGVPAAEDAYLWERQVEDIAAVLDHLGLDRAHIVGWSMGAYAALQFARLHPGRVASLVAAGVGSGSPAAERDGFREQMRALAALWETDPAAAAAEMAEGPGRQPFRRADPAGFAAWLKALKARSPAGMARTCRNYQALRPSLEDFAAGFARLDLPVLLILGDQDAACAPTTRWLAGALPDARLLTLPGVGHAPNLEAPAAFNQALEQFWGHDT